jgi:hypothetical protein
MAFDHSAHLGEEVGAGAALGQLGLAVARMIRIDDIVLGS